MDVVDLSNSFIIQWMSHKDEIISQIGEHGFVLYLEELRFFSVHVSSCLRSCLIAAGGDPPKA